MKKFYILSNIETEQGLWYDFKGNFTGIIQTKFTFCKNNDLPMPFDQNIVGWLSATETLEELYNWFTIEDIEKLENFGFCISIYETDDYKYYNNHWIINQKTSKFIERLYLNK